MARSSPGRDFTVERIAPGVFAAIAAETGYGLCNAGIVDLGGATVVFDSMLTPAAGQALARTAERLTGRRPAWVVNSHWHGDHIWGNGSFVDGHVVATRRTREVVLRRSRQQFRDCRRAFPRELEALDAPTSTVDERDRPQLRSWFRGVLATPTPFRIVPPEVTFTDELVLEGARRSLRLVSYGGGHSPSDVFGYLSDEETLFTGDLALVGYHLSLGDGRTDEWIRILERMRRLRVRALVPGHGPRGTRTALDESLEYLRAIRTRARRAVAAGSSVRAFRRAPVPERFRGWRFSIMYPENLDRAFRLARRAAR